MLPTGKLSQNRFRQRANLYVKQVVMANTAMLSYRLSRCLLRMVIGVVRLSFRAKFLLMWFRESIFLMLKGAVRMP